MSSKNDSRDFHEGDVVVEKMSDALRHTVSLPRGARGEVTQINSNGTVLVKWYFQRRNGFNSSTVAMSYLRKAEGGHVEVAAKGAAAQLAPSDDVSAKDDADDECSTSTVVDVRSDESEDSSVEEAPNLPLPRDANILQSGVQALCALAHPTGFVSMKVAVVTGSSSGIGKETACALASQGFHVVFACRNQSKTEPIMNDVIANVPHAKLTFLQLDTGKMTSVKTFAAAYLDRFDRLDVLVHNAGSGYFVKSERTTEDGLEAFFQTNYLGPFFLTKLLLDVLKKSRGRVVCVSSIEHWEGSYDFEKVTQRTGPQSYATSKLMQMLFAFELRRRHGICAAAVNPGAVMSGIWWYLRGWKATLWNSIAPLFLLNTQQGSATIVHASTAAEFTGPAYFTPYKQKSWSPYYTDLVGIFNGATAGRPDPRAYREEYWQQLWDFSEQKVQAFL